MKIRICYPDGQGNPTKEVRIFQDGNTRLVQRFRENGIAYIGIKTHIYSEDYCHIWKYIKELTDYKECDKTNGSNQTKEEFIITYVVEP